MRIINPIKSEILKVSKVLGEKQGSVKVPKMDSLDCLIETILSQNTNDINRDKAFKALKNKYLNWEMMLDLEPEEIVDTIRVAGLANQKSDTILRTLKWLNVNFGSLNLDWLCELKTEEIYNLFIPIKGIGIKTISIVCCFGLGRDIFPVDTHVNRICKRLGWVDVKSSANQTFYEMAEVMPGRLAPTFHILLINHGRTICTARNPRCNECPLRINCKSYRNSQNNI